MADLCYRHARDKADLLGQVWTPKAIANLLAETISFERSAPLHLLDLGAGAGALTKAVNAHRRCDSATLLEVDPDQIETLKRIRVKNKRVILAEAISAVWVSDAAPNVIVSNPPYGTVEAHRELVEVVKASAIPVPLKGKWVRSDAAFIAKAWLLAERGTRIGVIVAAPVITQARFQPMRSALVNGLKGMSVTKLSPLTFASAEVSAYIISGQRAVSRNRNVILRKADSGGNILEEIVVCGSAATRSLDIDFHTSLRQFDLSTDRVPDTLGSLGARINRGSRTLKEYKDEGIGAFHTTDFPADRRHVILNSGSIGRCHTAKRGDILISRVGTRCLARQVKVSSGTGVFTDCIYRISADRKTVSRVWRTLNSEFGAAWRQANAEGSCAKHITLGSLLSMPIFP